MCCIVCQIASWRTLHKMLFWQHYQIYCTVYIKLILCFNMWEPILPNKVILIKIPAQVEKKKTQKTNNNNKKGLSVLVLYRSPGNNQVNIALMALQTSSSQQKALKQFSDTLSVYSLSSPVFPIFFMCQHVFYIYLSYLVLGEDGSWKVWLIWNIYFASFQCRKYHYRQTD